MALVVVVACSSVDLLNVEDDHLIHKTNVMSVVSEAIMLAIVIGSPEEAGIQEVEAGHPSVVDHTVGLALGRDPEGDHAMGVDLILGPDLDQEIEVGLQRDLAQVQRDLVHGRNPETEKDTAQVHRIENHTSQNPDLALNLEIEKDLDLVQKIEKGLDQVPEIEKGLDQVPKIEKDLDQVLMIEKDLDLVLMIEKNRVMSLKREKDHILALRKEKYLDLALKNLNPKKQEVDLEVLQEKVQRVLQGTGIIMIVLEVPLDVLAAGHPAALVYLQLSVKEASHPPESPAAHHL